jgi:hypothetical protein
MKRQSKDPVGTEEAQGKIVNWRLLLKTVIKTGILLGRNVQAVGQSVYGHANELVVEAKAELDRKKSAPTHSESEGGSD